MKELMSKSAFDKMKKEAKKDVTECGNYCNTFAFMITPFDLGKLFVRYIRTDISNPDDPIRSYRWICFDTDGNRLDCDPIFSSVEDENQYKKSMLILHEQKYLINESV